MKTDNKEMKQIEKRDIRTYQDYISFKVNPTDPYLMISELIDNSISSFDNKFGEDNWGDEVLTIYIDFYFNPSKTQTKTVHGTKVRKKSYIRVCDNAYGMDYSSLIDAIRLNRKNNDSTSSKNVHGRGLKQCAFFFGADLEIETITEKGECSYSTLTTSIHSPEDEVTLTARNIPADEIEYVEERGTCISITNIYDNRHLTLNKYEGLINSISHRYIKMIKSGRMEILYAKDINSDLSIFETKDEVDELVSYVREGHEKYNGVKIGKIINQAKADIKKMENAAAGSRKFGTESLNKYKKEKTDAINAISSLLTEHKKDNDLLYKWTQTLDINGKELDVTFWRTSKNTSKSSNRGYSHLRGYRVYEGDRAIYHPPVSDDESGSSTYYKGAFPSGVGDSGSTHNRFAGEFNIEQINASTASDKSKFIFEDAEDEDILNSKLGMIWRIYDTFEMRARSGDKDNKGLTNKEADQVISTIESKFEKNVKDPIANFTDKGEVESIAMALDVDKVWWNIRIKIDNSDVQNKIWDRKITEEDGIPTMEITTYTGHKLWKKIDNSKEFLTEAVFPITIFIAHYEISSYSKAFGQDYDINKIKKSDDSRIDDLNESGGIVSE